MQVEIYGTVALLGDEVRTVTAEGFSGIVLFSGELAITNPPASLTLDLYQGFKLRGTQLGRERTYHSRVFRRVLLNAGVRVVYVEEAGATRTGQ